MNQQVQGIFGDEEKIVGIKEMVAIYLSKWPLFLICLIVGLSVGFVYSYYVIPKYIATTSFLIKGDNEGSNSKDLIEEALNGKKEINLSNEIVQLRAASLMRRTVAKNSFNVSYYLKGRIHSIETYKGTPFSLVAQKLTDSNSIYEIHVKQIDPQGGNFLYGQEKDEKLYNFKWNTPFTVSGQSFMLTPNRIIKPGSGEYFVRWSPIAVTAGELSAELGIRPYDPETSILIMSLKTENLERGKDVLNALFKEFNLSDIESRKRVTDSTIAFIDARLTGITDELKEVETVKEKYQGGNQVVDIPTQSTMSLANADEATKAISAVNVKQQVANMMINYFANPANDGKPAPAVLGLDDPMLSSLMTQYNEVQLRKEREKDNIAPGSTVMQDFNTQSSSIKGSILENLNNISKNLKFQAGSFQEQRGVSTGFLSGVPRNARAMKEIERKQGITEQLYLYLFEKREEVAISGTADNVAHYRQLDPASGFGPIEPNRKNILIFGGLAGLFAAFGWIYAKNVLNNKIISREAIVRQTSIPLLGQISHIPKNLRKAISITDRSIIGEQFRAIRTNLSFLIRDKTKKVIMVTSTVSGEGKSFISLNLAAVYAVPGKKVALLEFDIRQPVIASNLKISTNRGITNYLSDEIDDLSEIYYSVDEMPTLHIYPCGPTTLNPADLLLTDRMNSLFEDLRRKYDFVIVDSPPAGLVTDPFIIGAFSDTVIYVVRNQKTTKKQLDFANDIVRDKALNNVTMILNDVKKHVNYGYGYGSDANYGYYNGVKKKKKYSVV